MALYEFYCKNCKIEFEQITSAKSPKGQCPKCNQATVDRKISLFAVGGRGDLRESTMHGCHEPWSPGQEGSSHKADQHHCHSHCSHSAKTGSDKSD